MKATLKDVAEEAGVSKALVSKFLAGTPDARMRDETRKRIEDPQVPLFAIQAGALIEERPDADDRARDLGTP